MRSGHPIDRLDLLSNSAGAVGTLAIVAFILSIHSSPVVSADSGGAATEIALDLSAEQDSSEPPAPEPPQDAPLETPAPEAVADTPPPSLERSPILASAKPAQPKREKPKPKTVDEKPQREKTHASERARESREKPARAQSQRGERSNSAAASRSGGNASAFRACLAGAPYPSSKDARLQKPSGSVGIVVSGGGASVTRSSGSAILDQAARSRAVACAAAAGGGTLTGVVVFHPR